MPRWSRPSYRSAPPPVAWPHRSTLGAAVDGTVVMALALAIGLGLGLFPARRGWALGLLGYGWLAVAAWLVAAVLTLRYRRRSLRRNWRWWAGAAALVAITIGALSLFRAGAGVLAHASLGGYWGTVLGGAPPVLGILKLSAIAALTPLVVAPRRVSRSYWRGLQSVGVFLHQLTFYLHFIVYWLKRTLRPRLRVVTRGRVPFRQTGRMRLRLTQLLPGGLRNRLQSSPIASLFRPRTSSTSETDSLWAGHDAGTIPEWVTADLPPSAALELERRRLKLLQEKAAQQAKELENRTRELSALNRMIQSEYHLDSTVAEAPEPPAEKSQPQRQPKGSKWSLPPLTMLAAGERHQPPQAQLQQIARQIETTLEDHGVTVEVKDIKAGPRVVRFGLVPGWVSKKGELGRTGANIGTGERSRVKVQSILSREKDLALALRTPYIRIEAPVPGESLVGLEVPTPSPSQVPLRSVMDTPVFRKVAVRVGIPIALGQDTGGNPVALDLEVLPHFLIAGATGSGKSVCINSIIISLLLTRPPTQLRLLMVDPKRVELTPFNGIPHLIAPVIVEADEVNGALRALTREMLSRYKRMEESGTRNIGGYNARTKERIPYLVLIVDELADLMMIGGFEVERNLVRLAQLGRATGIHLVLATQRPSVNVVTGLLKANIPSRVAFAVASQVDSRVILDTIGAEKLLGKGDMLLLSHDSPKPRRIQGTLVQDEEVNKVVDFWRHQKGPPLPLMPIDESWDEEEEGEDLDEDTLDQARELAARNPRLSASFLERRLRIGGRRAAQIMGLLEEEGLVLHN